MKTKVLRGAYGIVGDELAFERRALDIFVKGDRISAIEPAGLVQGADEVIDLAHHFIVPGFINCHLHSHEHFHRGRHENLPLEIWQYYLRTPVPLQLTARQVYAFRKLDIPVAPFVVTLIFGPLIEKTLRQTLEPSGGNYGILLASPESITFLLLTIGIIVAATLRFSSRFKGDSE